MASRILGPADYGALVSMLALLIAIAIPSQAIQMVVTKFVSTEELSGRLDRIAGFVFQAMIRSLILGSVIWLALIISSRFLADFLHLQSPAPIIAVGFAGLVWLALPVVRGTLQGFQQFNHLGLNLLVDGIVRLGIGAFFFFVGFRVTGGVYAGGLAGALACVLTGIPLRRLFVQPVVKISNLEFKQLYRYGVPVVLSLGAFMLLTSLDVIMVKHYFIPEQAGYYSAGSLVGKAFLFLPFAVAQVLFPKVSAGQERAENTYFLLRKSLLLTGGIIVVGVILIWFVAPVIILTLFGKQFMNSTTLLLVQCFGMAFLPLALIYILLQYNIAIQNKRFVVVLLLDMPVFLLSLIFFHASLQQVLLVVGLNHLLTCLACYFLTPRKRNV